jgi:hypothetical protein
MAFTDNCSLFAAVHEEGINRVVRHIMRQRPSLFNYATADIASNRERWCHAVEHTEDVTKYFNPLFTILPPLPVIGADSPPVSLGFTVQLVRAQIDFHPGNVFGLPPELNPLAPQRFALFFRACGAVGCPSSRVIDFLPVTPTQGTDPAGATGQQRDPIFIPGEVECFCLEVYVVGHIAREVILGKESLVGKVDGIEIVDIKPEELENSVECYVRTAVSLLLRQKLAIPLVKLFFEIPLFGLGTISLFPTPNPPIPNNPAVEEDQVKAFITMTV